MEIRPAYHSLRLLGQGTGYFRQGHAGRGVRTPRAAAKSGQRLEMDAAHVRSEAQRHLHKLPQPVHVDAPGNCGHQYDAKARFAAGPDCLQLVCEAWSAAQDFVSLILCGIALQINGIEPCGLEGCRVSRFRPQTQAVGIALDQPEASFPRHTDDAGEIIPDGGLSAGKLNIAGPGRLMQPIHLESDAFKGRIGVRGRSRASIADRAAQMAPLRNLDKPRAGMLTVVRAQAAIIRAAPFPFREGTARIGRHLVPHP